MRKDLIRYAILFASLITAGCAGTYTYSPPPEQPAPQARTVYRPKLPTIPYTIQAGAFSESRRAAAYAERLRGRGIDAYYFLDKDRLYKVRFERFISRESARRRAERLAALGLIEEYYIVDLLGAKKRVFKGQRLRANIVRTAKRFLGTPYRWGGTSAETGFDCSGLAMTVYRLNGLNLPRNSYAQYVKGIKIRKEDLKKGDLVFFATKDKRRISHVGIYAGDGLFIHAPGRGKTIRISSIERRYYRKHFKGACRYF